jgi:glycine dehydrogenase subunit 1
VVSLGLLKSPGEMGADIVVGEGQSLGVGLQFGGPHLGLFACNSKHVRQMPGRLCGETVDADGRRGFVLTLSTREQHIRREKATSNICTNSGLMSLAFTIHMTLLGEKGLRHLAELNHARACEVADRVAAIPGVKLLTERFFNEFAVELPVPARQAVRDMAEMGVLGGVGAARLWPGAALDNVLLIAVTETVSPSDIDALVRALHEVVSQ